MFMSESIFFNGAKIFRLPGSMIYGLLFYWLIFLFIVSIILKRSKDEDDITDITYTGRLNAMDYCIIGLLLISFFGVGSTMIHYSILTDVFKEFVVLISLFVSYFIIKNWTSKYDPEILVNFLFAIVVINSIAAFFYVVHQGLHFGIYPVEEYSVDIVQNVEITRSFYFMPQFLPFSVAYLLIFRNKKPLLYWGLIAINMIAIFVSYTRSMLFNAAFIFLCYFIFVGLKEGRIGLVIKNILIFSLLGILGILIMSVVLPANTKFFMSRFTELKQTSATSDPNNIEFRFQMTGIIVSSMDDDSKILGMGSVTENQVSWVRAMEGTTADMVWTGVIFRWGFVGLILFILLYIFSGFSALSYFMKTEGIQADLALLFLLYIMSQVVESFVSWTFMSGHGFATGLWYFAMLSALMGFSKNEELKPSENLD
jgi:hypothetical protein